MKKGLLITIGLILFLGITGVIFYIGSTSPYFEELTYKEFFKKYESKESFALVIEQEGCSHCESYNPKIKKFANENKLKVYYVVTTKFTADETAAFHNLIGYEGTPVTIFVKDGVESTMVRINGDASLEKITNSFKTAGFIK